MNRLYNTYTVLYHSYLQCTSLSGHVPGSSLKSKWIRETEYVLCPQRTEVFYKQTAFHNVYPLPSYIQRKKSTFPLSLWKKFSLCCLLQFLDFLEKLKACHNCLLWVVFFNIFRDVSLFWFLYKVCNVCTFFFLLLFCCTSLSRNKMLFIGFFCIDQSQHQQSDWVLQCTSVAVVDCPSI